MSLERDLEEFIDGLGLQHFRGRELTPYWSRPKNTIPPVALWPNIVKTIRVLDCLRDRIGQPITITSSYRSPAYNRSVGGEPNSFHMRFMALDFQTRNRTPREVAAILKPMRGTKIDLPGNENDFPFHGGIGIYPTFIHVDTRGYDANW